MTDRADIVRVWMRRAEVFAIRHARESQHVTRPSVVHLSYHLAFRAGLTIQDIADYLRQDRAYVSRRVAAMWALMRDLTLCAEIDVLSAEMGTAVYERDGAVLPFGGPRQLTRRCYVAEGVA